MSACRRLSATSLQTSETAGVVERLIATTVASIVATVELRIIETRLETPFLLVPAYVTSPFLHVAAAARFAADGVSIRCTALAAEKCSSEQRTIGDALLEAEVGDGFPPAVACVASR